MVLCLLPALALNLYGRGRETSGRVVVGDGACQLADDL
jgi:hypothetical protein